MTIKKVLSILKKSSWRSLWAGEWGLLSCSEYGGHYVKTLRFGRRIFLPKTVFLYQNGNSSAWAAEEDIFTFSRFVADKIKKDPHIVQEICAYVRREARNVISILEEIIPKEPSQEEYMRYVRAIQEYYVGHVQMKYVVDVLSEKELRRYLPKLQKARVYAEPVFDMTKEYEQTLCKKIGKKMGYDHSILRALTAEELKQYFSHGALPEKKELRKRYTHCLFYIDKETFVLLSGKDSTLFEKIIRESGTVKELKGQCAFPWSATGRVKIIPNPKRAKNFKTGDVLVASMTRPDYLSLMKRAVAIVTDAGGILSHAAITARELKKPCIIGTKHATITLKDGDRVRVDATKGIVYRV